MGDIVSMERVEGLGHVTLTREMEGVEDRIYVRCSRCHESEAIDSTIALRAGPRELERVVHEAVDRHLHGCAKAPEPARPTPSVEFILWAIRFPIEVEEHPDGGFVAEIATLPDCAVHSMHRADAIHGVKILAAEAVAARLRAGEDV